ncbi:MAG: energy transducer TonB [Cytophagales bacterium]|nr:energy transducer TonB [Cytophagales bacterium]
MESKKNPNVDLTAKRPLFLNLGLVLSLSLMIGAFSFGLRGERDLSQLAVDVEQFDDIEDVVNTSQPPPPPPKVIQQPQIVEVPDEEEIEEEIEVNLDMEVTEETEVEEAVFEEEEPEEEAEEIFTIVEEQPSFGKRGIAGFYKFVKKKLKYPAQARRMGIQGRVILQFVVDEQGSISDINVLKGIGAGCDEEAIRVMKLSPKWKPGKQRGRPVKVRMVMPIVFKLN